MLNNKIFRLVLAAVVLSLLVIVAFHKAFDNNFVDFDDFTYVVNNDLVRDRATTLKEIFTTPVSSNYHPLTILSMRINSNECSSCENGVSPAPFIAGNIIIHALNTILVLLLIFIITDGNLLVAALTAVIFGIHPMHVESVAWISERKDVLYSFFFLSGLIMYLLYKKTGKFLWIAVCFILFVLSCLSKGMAVVFPVALILLNYWYDKRSVNSLKDLYGKLFSLKSAVILIPFFLVSLLFGVLAYRLQGGLSFPGIVLPGNAPDVVDSAGPFSLIQKIQHASYGFVTYIVRFFLPFHLSAFYPYPGTAEFPATTHSFLLATSLFPALVVAAAVVWSARKSKLYVFGFGFYFVTVALVLQFIPVGYAIIADRYTYLPYIGLAFIAASLIAESGRFKKYLIAFSVLYVTVLFIITMRQAETWTNTESLWSNTINKFPGVEIARRSRGKYYSKIAMKSSDSREKRKYQDLALIDFMAAIESGSRNAEVYEGAGVILGSKGDYRESLRYLNAALRLDSLNGSIYFNRALTLSRMGLNDEAVDNYTTALRYSPDDELKIRTNRSNILLSRGRFREVIEDLDFMIKHDPGNPDFYFNRAMARQATNNIPGAIQDYRKVLAINPKDEQARSQLNMLLK